VIYSEIEIAYPLLNHSVEQLGFGSAKEFQTYFSELTQCFSEFTEQEEKFFSYQTNPQIIELVYQDMCMSLASINSTLLTQLCKTTLKNYYDKGLSGFLKRFMYFLTSYNNTMSVQGQTKDVSTKA
jgi:hypothetical protein